MHKRIWLITKRLERNWSQIDLANLIEVTPQTIMKIEKGAIPSGTVAFRLGLVLEFDMNRLFTDNPENYPMMYRERMVQEA